MSLKNRIDIKYRKVIDHTLVWQIIFIAILILSGTIYWNRKLNKEVIRRKYAEGKLKKTKQQSRRKSQT